MATGGVRAWGTGLVTGAVVMLGVIVAGLVVAVVVPPALSRRNDLRSQPTPAQFVNERRLLDLAIEDVRFIPPDAIGTVPEVCSHGSFMPETYICGYEGEATFPATADMEALKAHLEQRGWLDNNTIRTDGYQPTVNHIRVIEGTLVCLSTHGYGGVQTLTARISTSCRDDRLEEERNWSGWDLFVPEVVPARFAVRGQVAGGGVLMLAFRTGALVTPPLVEVSESRLNRATTAEDCFAEPVKSTLTEPTTCQLVRTTPGGHELHLTSPIKEVPASGFMRRWWVTTIGRTRLVIEAVDIRPGQAHAQVALADAELDELVDSLRPAAYPEIGVAYPADANGVGTAYRYDEPVPPPPPKVCEALPGRPDLVMCREV